jgi:hypothetical protein
MRYRYKFGCKEEGKCQFLIIFVDRKPKRRSMSNVLVGPNVGYDASQDDFAPKKKD